jgi:hypothetical protein
VCVCVYCNGPLPLNGQLVTDVISVVTDRRLSNYTQRIEVTVVTNTSVSRNTVTNSSVVSAATIMHCDWIEAFHQ